MGEVTEGPEALHRADSHTRAVRRRAKRRNFSFEARRREVVLAPSSVVPLLAGVAGLVLLWGALNGSLWLIYLPPVICALALSVHKWGAAATGLILALCTIALSGLASQFAPNAASFNEVALVVLAGLGFRGLLAAHHLPPAVKLSAGLFSALAVAGALVSAQASIDYAARGLLALILPILVVLAVLGLATKPSPVAASGAGVRAVRAVLLSAVVLNVVLGLRQGVFGLTGREIAVAQAQESTYLVGEQIRLMGAFRTNQDFGLFLTFFSPVLLVLAIRRQGAARIAYGCASAALYAVSFLSLLRTPLIAAIPVGLLGAFLALPGHAARRLAKLLFAGVAVVAASAVVLSQLQVGRVGDALERATSVFRLEDDTSFNMRLGSTLPRAWNLLWSNPLGLGSGSAGPISQQFPTVAPAGTVTADNGYLMIAVQLGVIGACVFIAMLASLVRWLIRSPCSDPLAAGIGTMSLLVAMVTSSFWSLSGPIALAAAYVGLGCLQRSADGLDERLRVIAAPVRPGSSQHAVFSSSVRGRAAPLHPE